MRAAVPGNPGGGGAWQTTGRRARERSSARGLRTTGGLRRFPLLRRLKPSLPAWRPRAAARQRPCSSVTVRLTYWTFERTNTYLT